MKLIRELKAPSFEKTAGKFLLGENPSTYASELIAHLYKQHPFLGKYDVSISIDGQDQRLGYMYGVFIIKNAKMTPPEIGQKRMDEIVRPAEGGQAGGPEEPSLRIPIIVENKKAYSFDVFINPDGRFMPLNEARVAATLFEAGPYSVAPKGSDLPNLASQQAPNFRPDAPDTAIGASRGSFGKMGSAILSLSGHVSSDAVESFLAKVASDQRLIDAVSLNESFSKALTKLAAIAEVGVAAPSEEGSFDVAVIAKGAGGYKLKVASFEGGDARSFDIPNEYSDSIPLEARQDVFNHGVALMVSSGNEELLPISTAKGLETVKTAGVYSVISKTGSAQRAVVLPEVQSLAGRKMDMCIVVGPSGASFQEKVAGIPCGEVALDELSGSEPGGEGFFLFKSAGVVSEPMTITNTVIRNGEKSYLYEHPLRGSGEVKLGSVLSPVEWETGSYLIPEDSVFVPLSFGHGYESDTVLMNKVASRHDLISRVTLRSDGSNYSFSGVPVSDLSEGEGLTKSAALLVLGLLGDSPSGAHAKLAEASTGTAVEFVATRTIANSAQGAKPNTEMSKIARSIKVDLTKEASVLTGADTVDSVLSLNFVTPENIQGYVDMIPDLEQASFKLAELLVGVRLGLSDVPESAVSSSLSGVERAINGLKKLQIRSNVSM